VCRNITEAMQKNNKKKFIKINVVRPAIAKKVVKTCSRLISVDVAKCLSKVHRS